LGILARRRDDTAKRESQGDRKDSQTICCTQGDSVFCRQPVNAESTGCECPASKRLSTPSSHLSTGGRDARAATAAGLRVASIKIGPEGGIEILTAHEASIEIDAFSKWKAERDARRPQRN
jgi:hypothetical protein